jgi:hypothetical protein
MYSFKVFYLFNLKLRFKHENKNGAYALLPFCFADFTVTAVCAFPTVVPCVLVLYVMMGLPSESIGYVIVASYVTGLCAEALVNVLTQVASTVSMGLMLAQGLTIGLSLFAVGAFIREVPPGFRWLADITHYRPLTRGIMTTVFKHISYTCTAQIDATAQTCIAPGSGTFRCDEQFNATTGTCIVSGSHVLDEYASLSTQDNIWIPVLVLCAQLFVLRFLTYVLMRWPVDAVLLRVKDYWKGDSRRRILAHENAIDSLESRLHMLLKEQKQQQTAKQDSSSSSRTRLH